MSVPADLVSLASSLRIAEILVLSVTSVLAVWVVSLAASPEPEPQPIPVRVRRR